MGSSSDTYVLNTSTAYFNNCIAALQQGFNAPHQYNVKHGEIISKDKMELQCATN